MEIVRIIWLEIIMFTYSAKTPMPFFLCLVFAASMAHAQHFQPIQNFGSPRIGFRPDTLFIPSAIDNDSIWVYNYGENLLLLDSVKNVKGYGWNTNILSPADTFWIQIPFYLYHPDMYSHFPIRINPGDSALFIFEPPDLCPICGTSPSFSPFEDSLYFFHNDSANNPFILFAHGVGIPSNVMNDGYAIANGFALRQNHPNPFNPKTTIPFTTPVASRVEIAIYNLHGRKIRTLAGQTYFPGDNAVVWNGVNDAGHPAASGLYFYKLIAGKISLTRKLLLLR